LSWERSQADAQSSKRGEDGELVDEVAEEITVTPAREDFISRIERHILA
jgi:hypothetical protein